MLRNSSEVEADEDIDMLDASDSIAGSSDIDKNIGGANEYEGSEGDEEGEKDQPTSQISPRIKLELPTRSEVLNQSRKRKATEELEPDVNK